GPPTAAWLPVSEAPARSEPPAMRSARTRSRSWSGATAWFGRGGPGRVHRRPGAKGRPARAGRGEPSPPGRRRDPPPPALSVDSGQARKRLGEARVARLATADAGGVPHVVPFVFVLDGETIYWAVDEKPKRTRDLKRLANIRANPNVDVVVDHYDEDWRTLWWVRASGP